MNHKRTMRSIIRTNIGHIKAGRFIEIKLDGSTLPGSSKSITDFYINLRTIKSTTTFIYFIFQSKFIQRLAQAFRCSTPISKISNTLFWTSAKIYQKLFKSKMLEHIKSKDDEFFYFFIKLFRSTNDMSIILCKSTNSHQTMQNTRPFITIDSSQFRKTDGKLSITM